MSIPTKGDVLTIPVYTQAADNNTVDVSWSQQFLNRTQRYYIVEAFNQSKDNAAVLIFIQDSYYKDTNSSNYIGNRPGFQQEGSSWIVSISDQFQFGQNNSSGEGRWLVLQDKNNKMLQFRFLLFTLESSSVSEETKNMVKNIGGGDVAQQISRLQNGFVSDYLKTF